MPQHRCEIINCNLEHLVSFKAVVFRSPSCWDFGNKPLYATFNFISSFRPIMICSSTSSSCVEWLTFEASLEGCSRIGSNMAGNRYEIGLQCPLSVKHSYAHH